MANGELLSSISGGQLQQLCGMDRGTQYQIEVYAQYSDGTERLVGENEITTEGPSATLSGYALP